MTDLNDTTDSKASEASFEEGITESEEASQDGTLEATDVETEVALIKDQLLRALAETENVRRRAAKEKEDASKYSVTNFARDLLMVADNLRRALDNVSQDQFDEGSPEIKALLEGITMTEKELLSIFQKHGIQQISPHG